MFYLFAGAHYYPEGGWSDYRGTYPRVEDAKSAAGRFDWAQVVYVTDGRIVAERWDKEWHHGPM